MNELFIRFPIEDERYKDSREGGLAVTLAVISLDDYHGEFEACYLPQPNVFVADNEGNDRETYFTDYHTRDYSWAFKALIPLGKTTWSGYNEEDGHYFYATFGELTPLGTQLVLLLQKRFPDDKIVLLTFLDT